MIRLIIAALAGYLLGSVSVAVLLTKLLLHTDVRDQGSGNAGATNVARVFGMKAGLLTLLGDMVKTALSGLIGWKLGGEAGLAAACLGCLVGHCFPVFFGFKGGKGVSVGASIALLLDWRLLVILVACFLLMFVLTRRVSAGSVTCALAYPIVYYLLHPGFGTPFYVCCAICVLVTFMHRGNIRRLLRGEEPKFKPKSKKDV